MWYFGIGLAPRVCLFRHSTGACQPSLGKPVGAHVHQSLIDIQQQLDQIAALVRKIIASDEPFGSAHGSWNFPNVTKENLAEEAETLSQSIEDFGADEVGEHEALLTDYVRRLAWLQTNVIPNIWGNPGLGVLSYMEPLRALRKDLAPALTRDLPLESRTRARDVTRILRGLEAQIKALEPRTASLANMVEVIERAYNAADQLPSDLEALAEAKAQIDASLAGATISEATIAVISARSAEIEEKLSATSAEAEDVLAKSLTAYAGATSAGLAAAFTERSKNLQTSMWFWIAGLVLALIAGGYFGGQRLQTLVELMKDPSQSASVLYPNLLISLLSIGAPIWFAWLSTKQIGQRFKLSEDYAFKAAVSRAYEGFRREAARIDPKMEARLLESALSRLDEQPLRFVDTDNHGSPWQEMMNSELVKEAVKTVPTFASQVKELAGQALSRSKPTPPAVGGKVTTDVAAVE